MQSSQQIAQSFLEARNALIHKDLQRHSGFLTARTYTRLMDRFIRALFLEAGFRDRAREILEEGFAIVALGSYGRRELCLGSDVDLLVLHQDRLSAELSDTITRVLYSLWDTRLDVGHGVMTIQGCLRVAMSDFRFLTSLMDMRLLLGSRAFFRLFEAAFWSKVDREKDDLLGQFMIYQEKRGEKYGTQGYFVEPDIKEGLGGLRDIHFMAWMARVYFRTGDLRQIKRFPVFSHFPLERLHHSESFILKVRNHLHRLAGGRREDRLLIPYQNQISVGLGYHDYSRGTGPERFMRNLYLHLNRIRYGSEEFRTRALDIIDPKPAEPAPESLPPEFQVMRGNLVLKEGIGVSDDPLLLLKAFAEANRRGIFLGSGLIWEAGHLIARRGRDLLTRPEARALFLDILLRPGNPKILRPALEIGLLTLFIPEFKRIRNLAQFSYYHLETVDLHLLRTIEVVHDISTGSYDDRWPVFKEVFQELKHPEWLNVAALLHDIGKGDGGDHQERGAERIPRILKRLGFKGEALAVIPFLVRHHLLLADTSQKRDLNDEKTAVQAAQTIGHTENLKLLFLLTIADSVATGPMAGGDWKIMLLIELYLKVRHILERGTLVSPDATKRVEEHRENLIRILRPRYPEKAILNLMDQVSTRYFLSTRLEDMAEHFHLGLTLGSRRLSWTLQKLRDAPVSRVVLCARDRPGLFSKMVGVFTLNNMDVLSGNIFTLKNGLAFDIYEVTNPLDPLREEEMWNKVFDDALLAVEDRLPLDEWINRKDRTGLSTMGTYPNPHKQVRIDNEASDFFTLIEVLGGARAGLLYDLAKEIHSQGLDIRFARVNRDKEKTTGVFYVRDASGQKVSERADMERIESGILTVIR
ncbi:MAG: [protein-PII] uridylyltransferase [Thermodesulfobacteriota bacterium]